MTTLIGWRKYSEKERHAIGEVVRVRQSVVGAGGRHQGRRIKDGF